LRGIIYLGDDITDMDAFYAVRSLRETEDVKTLGIGVVNAENRPDFLAVIDLKLHSVEGSGGAIALAGGADLIVTVVTRRRTQAAAMHLGGNRGAGAPAPRINAGALFPHAKASSSRS